MGGGGIRTRSVACAARRSSGADLLHLGASHAPRTARSAQVRAAHYDPQYSASWRLKKKWIPFEHSAQRSSSHASARVISPTS